MGEYISPKEYLRRHPDSNMGMETIKRLVRTGKMKGYVERDATRKYAHYHVWDGTDEKSITYTKEYIESVIRENAEMKEKLKLISATASL